MSWLDWIVFFLVSLSQLLYFFSFVALYLFQQWYFLENESFSIKLFHFLMFGSNFKWVEKQSLNFSYLACCEIKLFSKII